MWIISGSFTELKHDTVLYSKQVIAEMGDGDKGTPEPDDRGYVEPEPLVYARFAALAEQTEQGLQAYDMLTVDDKENLSRLGSMAEQTASGYRKKTLIWCICWKMRKLLRKRLQRQRRKQIFLECKVDVVSCVKGGMAFIRYFFFNRCLPLLEAL